MTNALLLLIIAMIAAYFIRENQLRKEQLQINKDLAQAIKALKDTIDKKLKG